MFAQNLAETWKTSFRTKLYVRKLLLIKFNTEQTCRGPYVIVDPLVTVRDSTSVA